MYWSGVNIHRKSHTRAGSRANFLLSMPLGFGRQSKARIEWRSLGELLKQAVGLTQAVTEFEQQVLESLAVVAEKVEKIAPGEHQ